MSEITQRTELVVNQDSKNLALLMWIGTIFFGFIPGLIFYLLKKDDEFILTHSKEALNWTITAIIAYIVALILSVIVIGVFLLPVIGLSHLIFCILGAIKSSNAKEFKVPVSIRLIK